MSNLFNIMKRSCMHLLVHLLDCLQLEIPEVNSIMRGGDPLVKKGEIVDFIPHQLGNYLFCVKIVLVVPKD